MMKIVSRRMTMLRLRPKKSARERSHFMPDCCRKSGRYSSNGRLFL
jgi:hypothetical protein